MTFTIRSALAYDLALLLFRPLHAGIALKSLDDLVRSEPNWAGCWRQRQALKCAATAVRLMGRNEDETALRVASP
jgi:hypothetical protein